MKIEVTEYVAESFIVEVPDGLVGDALADEVEAARVAYMGERSSDVNSVDWEPVSTTHEEYVDLLILYRPTHQILPQWMSLPEMEQWTWYFNSAGPDGFSYKCWLAGDEKHNPHEVARVLTGNP